MANVVVFGKNQTNTLPAKIYIDSNILIAAFYSHHQFYRNARSLLFLLIANNVEIYLSPLSFSESWWAIVLTEYKRKYKRSLKADWLKKNMIFINYCRTVLSQFKKYFDKKIQSGKIHILDIEKTTVNDAYDNMVQIPMMPNDSFHLAVMKSKGICTIATADRDFNNIPDPNFQVIAVR